ncbi:Ubiquitinyl hydrolase 1 [Lachancea thermotolerans]|uniref:ubiquitinyl hydrolase 1 n=1 Tax=Lachancea thermotolerans (strain ATCC 56472 / CBS 6340 / NRRL Y-8284) TaxID=559295 RepID=C5DF73_LACTC|nr:KLTH0D12760p [Lachancea thermotolerans CBS 6340]CAR22828.1 KLTH0D12760p [Lachancea thermotolerans CBS 6340]
MSCQHLDQIFRNEKTRDGVLRAYNMIRYIIEHSSFQNRHLHSMRCSECLEINCGSTFMCLQCGVCGCWNKSHFALHSKKAGHIFGVNSSNGLLFCFKCGDYVGGNETLINSTLVKYWDDISVKSSLPVAKGRDGLCGLVNMGSTCFMSSIIQTLVHNPYVLKQCMNQNHYSRCDIQDSSSCFSCALDQIVMNFYGPTSDATFTSQQRGFVDLLLCSWKTNKNLAGYSQQDAHEFLQFFLNQLHADHVRVAQTNVKAENCNCILHTAFQGSLRSSILCTDCQDGSNITFDPMMDLSLDIKNKSTLVECLQSFHKGERLTDFNHHCSSCGSVQNPIKQMTIAKLPPVLVLQLKRFEHLMNGNNVKLNGEITYPAYLNMAPFCHHSEARSVPDMVYELVAVISQEGSVNQGHYTCMCKVPGGQWFRFNDTMIVSITEEDVLRQQAYLLFYVIRQIG